MRRAKSKRLVQMLTLSLTLTSVTCLGVIPQALGATDATSTVTTSGTFNSIKVDRGVSEDNEIYAISKVNEDLSITMTGDKNITVTDNGINSKFSKDANVVGLNQNITLTSGEGSNFLEMHLTAQGGITDDARSANANATGMEHDGNNTINGDVKMVLNATGGNVLQANNDSYGVADASLTGFGRDNVINGNLSINGTATGGTAKGYDDSSVEASAEGLNSENGKVLIKGNLNITLLSQGGTATLQKNGADQSECEGMVDATATGISVFNDDTENTVTGDTQINVTAIGGKATGFNVLNGVAVAIGLSADAGTNTLQGNVFILTKASVKQEGCVFAAYSLGAGEWDNVAGINDLSSKNKIKILEGDVVANGLGSNNLTMDTASSYLQGNITSAGGKDNPGVFGNNNIIISNGAVWRPVYDNRYGTDCTYYNIIDVVKNAAANKVTARETTYDIENNRGTDITLKDGGIIDLTWDGWTDGIYDTTRSYRSGDNNGFRKLTIAKLNGADGIIKVDSNLAKNLADTIIIGEASTATSLKIQVNYDDFYANSNLNDIVAGKALVVTDNSGKLTVSGTPSEYNEKIYNIAVAQDSNDKKNWNLVQLIDVVHKRNTVTENTKHAADARDNVNNIFLIETNSLVKRLGDLRTIGKDVEQHDNVWGKYGHGSQDMGNGRDTEIKYNQFQIGYDKKFEQKNGKTYRGLMVSRINGDASYERGSGDTNSTTLALYQTWVGDKGHYYDVALRYGKITTDYNVTDLSNNYSHGDYSMWATTLSGEYGYRKALGHGLYIEPSTELILGHIGSANYTTSKDMDVYLDATKHAISRLGFVAGKEGNKGNVYFKGNYYHDFAGGGGVTTGTVNYQIDHPQNWWELGIGGNVKLSKNASAYGEIRKIYGNLKSNVNFSIGARWSF